MALIINNISLNKGEYYEESVKKDTIWIHHTAGGHRPDWTIAGWNADRAISGERLRVATAYVIGGKSTSNNDNNLDGAICNCFPDKYWAHHLGLTTANNVPLNKRSVAIELCNYGPIRLSGDGKFYNYINKPVPAEMVVELSEPFQGFKYYHKYTDKQISALKGLLLDLANRYSIDIRAGLKPLLQENKNGGAFLMNADARAGTPGLWTHTNVRKNKFDCSPQESLINMILSL